MGEGQKSGRPFGPLTKFPQPTNRPRLRPSNLPRRCARVPAKNQPAAMIAHPAFRRPARFNRQRPRAPARHAPPPPPATALLRGGRGRGMVPWEWSRARARRGPAQGAPRACACACDEALARERLREAGLRAPQNRLSPLEFLLRAPTDRPSVRLSIRLGRRDGGTGSTPPWAIGQNCSLLERTHMGCGPGCKSSKQVTPRKLSSTSARGGCAWSR